MYILLSKTREKTFYNEVIIFFTERNNYNRKKQKFQDVFYINMLIFLFLIFYNHIYIIYIKKALNLNF